MITSYCSPPPSRILLPPPPKPTENPMWEEKPSIIEIDLRVQDVFQNQIFQSMIDSLPKGGFKKAIVKASNKKISLVEVKNLTYPTIYMPNSSALQEIAFRYFEKYRILILQTIEPHLELVMQQIEEIEGPQFVGIIVSSAESTDYDSCRIYSLPLIVFLGKKVPKSESRVWQCFIADMLGMQHHALPHMVLSHLNELHHEEEVDLSFNFEVSDCLEFPETANIPSNVKIMPP